jgi:hypothetical protein
MDVLILLIILDIAVLIIVIKYKRFHYMINRGKYIEDAINEFDKNKKAIDEIDMSGYKLGSGHIYE